MEEEELSTVDWRPRPVVNSHATRVFSKPRGVLQPQLSLRSSSADEPKLPEKPVDTDESFSEKGLFVFSKKRFLFFFFFAFFLCGIQIFGTGKAGRGAGAACTQCYSMRDEEIRGF